jgi:type IX secretion system PorP/SprF family membrane protein
MKNTALFFFLLFNLLTILTHAQDPIFFNTQSNSTYINPAFTGIVKSFSVGINYRNQWPQISGNYQTTTLEINQFMGKGNGLSLLYVYDNAAHTLYKHELVGGYGKAIRINENHTLSLGGQVGYVNKRLDMSRLTFGDMIDPRRGFVYLSNELPKNSIHTIDFNAGALYYTKFIFAGITTKHLTQPNQSFFHTSSSRLPMQFSGQLGGKINVNKFTFVPSVFIYKQGSFDASAVFNLSSRYKYVQLDIGYWNQNGITGSFGLNFSGFSFGYSYGTSKIYYGTWATDRYSTHEIRALLKLKTFQKQNDNFFDF